MTKRLHGIKKRRSVISFRNWKLMSNNSSTQNKKFMLRKNKKKRADPKVKGHEPKIKSIKIAEWLSKLK